jgi:hypothetical protein
MSAAVTKASEHLLPTPWFFPGHVALAKIGDGFLSHNANSVNMGYPPPPS